jgi:AMMECR1 domain-containing protein
VVLWKEAGHLKEEHCIFVELAFTEPQFFVEGKERRGCCGFPEPFHSHTYGREDSGWVW